MFEPSALMVWNFQPDNLVYLNWSTSATKFQLSELKLGVSRSILVWDTWTIYSLIWQVQISQQWSSSSLIWIFPIQLGTSWLQTPVLCLTFTFTSKSPELQFTWTPNYSSATFSGLQRKKGYYTQLWDIQGWLHEVRQCFGLFPMFASALNGLGPFSICLPTICSLKNKRIVGCL